MTALEEAWEFQERLANARLRDGLCFLDLRRRVEALEARAAAEESSATEPAQRHPIKPRIGVLNASIRASMDRIQALVADLPDPAPAPAANRPLWEVMQVARYSSDGARLASVRLATAAEIDAVASWLEQRYLDRYPGAAELLRAEARRAREGA